MRSISCIWHVGYVEENKKYVLVKGRESWNSLSCFQTKSTSPTSYSWKKIKVTIAIVYNIRTDSCLVINDKSVMSFLNFVASYDSGSWSSRFLSFRKGSFIILILTQWYWLLLSIVSMIACGHARLYVLSTHNWVLFWAINNGLYCCWAWNRHAENTMFRCQKGLTYQQIKEFCTYTLQPGSSQFIRNFLLVVVMSL